jgi:hypothetical protein
MQLTRAGSAEEAHVVRNAKTGKAARGGELSPLGCHVHGSLLQLGKRQSLLW